MAGPLAKKTYGDIPVGVLVRRDIGQTYIFRVRRGNGHFGSNLGELYQDKYAYFVPTSITNAEGQTARDAFAQAVSNWQNVLSPSQKVEYNLRADRLNSLSGYNLYIREYVEANA